MKTRIQIQFKDSAETGLPDDDIWEIFDRIVLKINCSDNKYTVPFANRIYIREDQKALGPFVDKLGNQLKTDVVSVDFRTNVDSAAERISEWVEQSTKGRVKMIRLRDSLGVDTSMLVVNAVCLRADWKYPFSPTDTHPMKFHRPDDSGSYVS